MSFEHVLRWGHFSETEPEMRFCQTLRIDCLCLSHFQFAQLFYLNAIFHEQFELKHSLEKQLLC